MNSVSKSCLLCHRKIALISVISSRGAGRKKVRYVGYEQPSWAKATPPHLREGHKLRYSEDKSTDNLPLSEFQTTRAPKVEDAPFINYNSEAREFYWKGIIENMTLGKVKPYQVNPEEEPFKSVYQDQDEDQDKDQRSDKDETFTRAEAVQVPNVWFWVERILPKPVVPKFATKGDDQEVIYPSGWIPPPKVPPKLPYFVPRTRSNLLPVYKDLKIVDGWKDRQKVVWRKVLDHVPERQPEVTTAIQHVDGNVRQLEQELRSFLENKYKKKVLSAVHEMDGKIIFKKDYVEDVVNWLYQKGF